MVDIFADEMNGRFLGLLRETGRPGIDNLIKWLIEESDFFTAPASTQHHGAVEGGLLDHSLSVYDNLLKLATCFKMGYPPEEYAVVALLHDVCKANFYTIEMRNKKIDGKWEQVPFYAISDQYPYGHGEKSVDIIRDFIELTKEERMAIRWHMAFSDSAFKDYGGSRSLGAALDQYPLAVALHMADLAATYFDGK